ncbi:hypothetical protein CVS28_17405 [Arthrobacter glacialis]|nr:hypothetical protein CVS28_17405 [Arthrobacter glacialis]
MDGSLYATMYHRQLEVPAILNSIPAMLVDSGEMEHSGTSVIPNGFGSATAAVTTLIEKARLRQSGNHRREPLPLLTTAPLPHYEMGIWATENLMGAIDGKTSLGLFAGRGNRRPGARRRHGTAG